jgi:hypothetical protein
MTSLPAASSSRILRSLRTDVRLPPVVALSKFYERWEKGRRSDIGIGIGISNRTIHSAMLMPFAYVRLLVNRVEQRHVDDDL